MRISFMANMLLVFKDGLTKLNFILSRQQKIYGVIIFLLSMFGALLEMMGVGIIIPFVQLLLNIDTLIGNNNVWKDILERFHISTDIELIILMTILVMLLFLGKNIYFMFLSWVRIKYSSKIERELSVQMLEAFLEKEYTYFLNEDTAEIMKYISTDTLGTNQLVYHFLRAVTDIGIIIFIGIYLMITDWIIALGTGFMAGICVLIVYGYFRNKMRKAGLEYNFYSGKTSQYLLQSIMGIKEVLVLKRQRYFVDKYEYALTQRQYKYIQQTMGWEWPAYIIEGLCVTGILAVLCIRIAVSQEDLRLLIPMLSAFAIGAFRILPSLGRISAAINSAVYYAPSLNHVYNHLKSNEDLKSKKADRREYEVENKKIAFKKEIKVENIYWRYAEDKPDVICGLNLVISKGNLIGLVGQSGAGKSTLVDIILGILKPEKGSVTIDNFNVFNTGVDLAQILGYVPQNSYFPNDSIRNNVAFGIYEDEIDDAKVWSALEQAQLKEVVENLPEGLDTLMGDNGLHFSGGQRQRVAIARALYHEPEILIFDEATAALDNETERAVMESIMALKGHKTMLIIAHRLTTLRGCDFIYEIKDGKAYQRAYEELLN